MNRDQLLDDPEQQKKGIWGREDMSGEIKGKDGSVTTYNPIHPQEEQRIKGTSVLGGDNIKRETRDRDPIPEKMSTNRTPLYANSPTLPDQEQKPKAGALRKEEDHKGNDHVVSKESPKTINGRREDMGSTVEWGGGNIIAPNKRGGQPAESSHVEQKDFMSSNGTSGTKAPNQIDVHADLSKEQHINNFQLGRENSTHDHKINDMATSNSDLHSSDTNYIPIGIPIAENGDHVVSKESPKTINGRREDMGSTVEWGGGNIIAPNKRGGQPAESSHVEQKDFMSSNGTSGTKAPNQIDVHADLSKEQHINNFQLGRENSTHDHKINDMATSNSDLHSSDTNYIPIGIPIAENGDKGYEQQSRDHVSVTVSVKPDKVTTTITVKGHDERHESDEQNEGMTRNTTSSFQPPCPESPQYPNTDQNKNNKINDEPSCCERCKEYCNVM